MPSVVVLGGASTLCVLAAIGCTRSAYNETRRFAVPAQTSVTRLFDFSDDLSEPFDLPRRAYTALNPVFGEAFHLLNRDRVWDPASPQAIRASRHRGIVMRSCWLSSSSWRSTKRSSVSWDGDRS
jgi:hypothetical protein